MPTTLNLANRPTSSFFTSSALDIKAGKTQHTRSDVLKVFPGSHLCATTITAFPQRWICGVFTAGSVFLHGGSFLKSLTPC